VVLEQGNDLVYDLDGRMAFALRLADLLWVTAALLDKVVAVYPAMLACSQSFEEIQFHSRKFARWRPTYMSSILSHGCSCVLAQLLVCKTLQPEDSQMWCCGALESGTVRMVGSWTRPPSWLLSKAHCCADFPEKQVSSLHAQSIDHGIFIVKASELPNQVRGRCGAR
jgi:hypothetical protein